MEESDVRALDGRSKSLSLELELNRPVVLYPILSSLHPSCLQYPNTPKSTFSKVASGMPFTIGVEITDRSRSAKAARSSIVSGVAGLRSMAESWQAQ